MAWRNFRYCILHAGRDAGLSGISSANAFATTGPKDFLIDDRAGSLCTFAATASDHYIQWDRGAGSLEAIDRMLIPSGHNMAALTLRVRSSSTSDFSADVDVLVDSITTPSGLVDEDTDVSSTDRYVRMDWPGETGINPALGEVVFTRTRTTERGPMPGWRDFYRHNALHFAKESGVVASLSLGSDQRVFELIYRDVKLAADLDVFADLVETCGTVRPFYLDPAFDTESAVWVKLAEDSRQGQDPIFLAGTPTPQKEIPLSILEHLA